MKSKVSKRIKISESLIEKIQLNLEIAMEQEKLFLKPDIGIYQLAKKIGTNTTYLSLVIKDSFQTNFSQYLNTLRIKEAQQLIQNTHQHQNSIDNIAKLCGYSSRSTFYKAFKDIIGCTPNEYKKREYNQIKSKINLK